MKYSGLEGHYRVKTLIVSDGGIHPIHTKNKGGRCKELLGHYTVKKVICFPDLRKMISFYYSAKSRQQKILD
jgi:hypothetical protein